MSSQKRIVSKLSCKANLKKKVIRKSSLKENWQTYCKVKRCNISTNKIPFWLNVPRADKHHKQQLVVIIGHKAPFHAKQMSTQRVWTDEQQAIYHIHRIVNKHIRLIAVAASPNFSHVGHVVNGLAICSIIRQ